MHAIYYFSLRILEMRELRFLVYDINFADGPIAQLRLERTPDKREVTGSTPVRPTEMWV